MRRTIPLLLVLGLSSCAWSDLAPSNYGFSYGFGWGEDRFGDLDPTWNDIDTRGQFVALNVGWSGGVRLRSEKLLAGLDADRISRALDGLALGPFIVPEPEPLIAPQDAEVSAPAPVVVVPDV